MSAMETSLPPGFEGLERFVGAWAIDGANNRLRARLQSTEAERVAFFEAAKDLLAPGLDYLDKKPLGQFDAREKRLMSLFLSFAHISIAVEMQAEGEPEHAEGARHLTITRAPADL